MQKKKEEKDRTMIREIKMHAFILNSPLPVYHISRKIPIIHRKRPTFGLFFKILRFVRENIPFDLLGLLHPTEHLFPPDQSRTPQFYLSSVRFFSIVFFFSISFLFLPNNAIRDLFVSSTLWTASLSDLRVSDLSQAKDPIFIIASLDDLHMSFFVNLLIRQ